MFALMFNDGKNTANDIRNEFKASRTAPLLNINVAEGDPFVPLFWDIDTADRFVKRNRLLSHACGVVRLSDNDVDKIIKETGCLILEYPSKIDQLPKDFTCFTYAFYDEYLC